MMKILNSFLIVNLLCDNMLHQISLQIKVNRRKTMKEQIQQLFNPIREDYVESNHQKLFA